MRRRSQTMDIGSSSTGYGRAASRRKAHISTGGQRKSRLPPWGNGLRLFRTCLPGGTGAESSRREIRGRLQSAAWEIQHHICLRSKKYAAESRDCPDEVAEGRYGADRIEQKFRKRCNIFDTVSEKVANSRKICHFFLTCVFRGLSKVKKYGIVYGMKKQKAAIIIISRKLAFHEE